jgi:hypothetical protein
MKLVRLTVLAITFVLTAQFAAAQNELDGTWEAVVTIYGQRCTFNLVMTVGQHYTETLRCGNLMTWQAGTYVFSNGILVRDVTDWEPRKRYVLDDGYSGHYEENAKPPGGSFRVTFTSPDTMVWQDVNFGATLTYRRSE